MLIGTGVRLLSDGLDRAFHPRRARDARDRKRRLNGARNAAEAMIDGHPHFLLRMPPPPLIKIIWLSCLHRFDYLRMFVRNELTERLPGRRLLHTTECAANVLTPGWQLSKPPFVQVA